MARQQKQSTPGQLTKKTIRVPLAGNAMQRSTSEDKDQRFVNYLVETTKNSVTDSKKLFCIKRPGTVLHSAPSAAAVGRGTWYFNGAVWSVFGATLYKGTTVMTTLTTSTGMCGAVEFVNADDFSRPGLFLADGYDAWLINSLDVITRVDNKHLQWVGSTKVEAGDRRVPTALGSLWYYCTTSGTTGSVQPTWPTVLGNTVADGTTIWRAEGTYTGPAKWVAATAITLAGLRIPTTESGYWYEATVAGTTAAAQPTWPLTLGATVVDGSVTWKAAGEYGGFPTPHIPTPVAMDGYVFLPERDSIDVYNSNTTYPLSWGALSFASAESYPDLLVGLARQNNFVVAFGTDSTEFMYNYAKANQIAITDFDSPLDRHESMILQVGCLNRSAILGTERVLVFIGASTMGGTAVWKMDGTNAKEISTEYIEKFMDLENTTTAITGFGLRIAGHVLFIINLPTSNKTFVYDLEEGMWTEWQYNGGRFPFVAFCDANGTIVMQHSTNGSLYKLDPLVYNDFDVAITARIRLAKQDFDTDTYKFFHQTTLIGDGTTGSYTLRWSDNDYTTWSNDKVLPVGNRPYFMRSGHSRRRAWEIVYTDNSPSRLEALEVTYSTGDH